jgi:hypothetical protein
MMRRLRRFLRIACSLLRDAVEGIGKAEQLSWDEYERVNQQLERRVMHDED